MEWVIAVLSLVTLVVGGVGVYLWAQLQERQRELVEARVLRDLGVHEAERDRLLGMAMEGSKAVADLDVRIGELRREAVAVREKTDRMSAVELAEAFNALIRRTLVYLLVGAALSPASAQAQTAVPMEHDGQPGVWMSEADALTVFGLATEVETLRELVTLMEQRIALQNEIVTNLRTAVDVSADAQEAALLLAFGSEERALKAEAASSSPWGRLLWGSVGVVLGAAVGVLIYALSAGGG